MKAEVVSARCEGDKHLAERTPCRSIGTPVTRRGPLAKTGMWGKLPPEDIYMTDLDPNLITSGLSRDVTREGISVRLHINRLENQPGWALEVVNDKGTSTVWDELFETDDEADAAFRKTLAEEGIKAFLESATVIPFRR